MKAVWFFDHGVGIFPIVTPGKEPACKSWDDYTCTREHASRFKNFGVRLGNGLAVADTDKAETERWFQQHGPSTPFVVLTARGVHRYFRIASRQPKFIHRDGLTIEFRNEGQYVVGPGSVHRTGAVYSAQEWSWRWEDIPFFPADFLFDDGSCGRRSEPGQINGEGYEFPETVSQGERHAELFKLIRSMKALGAERETVRWLVTEANVNRCRPPLKEDATFESWFARAWSNPDRPLAPRPEPNPFGDTSWARF